MELGLKKERINYKKIVLNTKICHEVTQEVIVSDSLPDICEITDTFTKVFLRGKDTAAGKATVGGAIEAMVIFSAGDGSKTRFISAMMPFTVYADEHELSEESDIIANIEVTFAEAKMINPRKVLVKVNVCVHITCWNKEETDISCCVEENSDTECLISTEKLVKTKNINEKTFNVSDEYSVNSKNQPGEILASTVILYSDELKIIGTKAVVSGRAASKVLYLPEDSEQVQCAEFSTIFSQIVELNENGDGNNITGQIMLTGAYFGISEISGTGEKGIVAELHGVIQCVTSEETEIKYISDLFSTKHNLAITNKSITDVQICSNNEISVNARGSIPAAVAPEKIILTSSRLSDPTVIESDGIKKAISVISVKILYTGSDAQVHCATGSFECSGIFPMGLTDNHIVSANAGDEIYASIMGMEFEVRLPVSFTASEKNERNFCFISEVSYDENDLILQSDAPSIILYRSAAHDSVWALAKKFQTKQKLILEANELEESSELRQGQILIIPKSR